MPLFKDKIWGGNKIKDIIGIDYSPLERCGELWALSAIEDDETLVENGYLAELLSKYIQPNSHSQPKFRKKLLKCMPMSL